MPGMKTQHPTTKNPATTMESTISNDRHVIVIAQIQQAVQQPPQHQRISPRLPTSPKQAEKHRHCALPVVASPVASPGHKNSSFANGSFIKYSSNAIRASCIFGLCYFLMASTHVVFWIAHRQLAMTITYSVASIIGLATTIWVHLVSPEKMTPSQEKRLRTALTTKLVVSAGFAILGLANLLIDGLLYANEVTIEGMGLWKRKKFAFMNATLTVLELGLSIACCVIAVEGCKQLRSLKRQATIEQKKSMKMSSSFRSASTIGPCEALPYSTSSPYSSTSSPYSSTSSPYSSTSSTSTDKSSSDMGADPVAGEVTSYIPDNIEGERDVNSATGREHDNPHSDSISWE